MSRRQKWRRLGRGLPALFLLLFFLFNFFNLSGWFFDWRGSWFFPDRGVSRTLLCAAMPVMAWVEQKDSDLVPGPLTVSARKLLAGLTPLRLDVRDPVSVLKLSIPYLAAAELEQPAEEEPVVFPPAAPASVFPEKFPEGVTGNLTGDTLVIIYHTHTGETYALTDGTDRLEGKGGGVVQAGAAVKEVLESRYGIKAAHAQTIHDAKYDTSYLESEKTLRKLLAAHQGAKVVLDIHRDAGRSRRNSLVEINGREVAPILLVVGSDVRLPFPTWKKNYQFANELATRLNEKYSGLCLGVRVKDGRYNQFLHPRAVLVEIGSVNNSTGEAVASARLFADVLGQIIREMQGNAEKGE